MLINVYNFKLKNIPCKFLFRKFDQVMDSPVSQSLTGESVTLIKLESVFIIFCRNSYNLCTVTHNLNKSTQCCTLNKHQDQGLKIF